jgi:integrase
MPGVVKRCVRLDPGTTKNKQGRVIPLSDLMSHLLQNMLDNMTIDEKTPDANVFTFRGEPLRNFRTGWTKATKRAGMPHLLFHDLRRSAVRNMVRAGVAEAVCMAVSGHKTRSIFDRYNIVDEDDLVKAMSSMEGNRKSILKIIAGEQHMPQEIKDFVEAPTPSSGG